MRVLVVLGHPRSPSLCASLAAAYARGAQAAGCEVELLDLGALSFDPDVHPVSPREQPLEPDLERARTLIAWANHLVFVYPAWWGVGPARLRGFLDRVLLPGFAFLEHEDGRFEGLLRGRTAHLVTTMDMAPAIYHLIYRAPGLNAMRRSALGFCGVATTGVLSLGPVRHAAPEKRAAWIEKARSLGFSLQAGAYGPAARARLKLLAWLRALRLQFYPMSWMAYTVGALAAVSGGWAGLDRGVYWLGYLCLFCAKAATVFTNEWFDFEPDRRNRNYGPFNGGSRVLVEGALGFAELRIGIVAALMAAFAAAGLLLYAQAPGTVWPVTLTLALLFLLALGYTAPPLRLSWRGFGELDVGLTHSFGVMVYGWLLQGGTAAAPMPWLLALPLCLAVLPAIVLSGVPDFDADRDAGKRTLVVRLGIPRAIALASVLAVAAVLAALLLKDAAALAGTLDGLLPWALPHAALLAFLLRREHHAQQARPGSRRIDGLMVAALTYIVWFALIPLVHLA